MRLRPQPRTGPCGERLLWPYVPLGTKRISNVGESVRACVDRASERERGRREANERNSESDGMGL